MATPKSAKFALPSQNDVRPVNPVLTDLSIAFRNDEFIWDQVAPVVRTDEKSGTYFIWTRDYWMRTFEEAGGAKRAPESPYKRLGYGLTTDTFDTIEYGFEKPTGDSVANSSQTPESLPDQDTQFLTNLIEMELERLVASSIFVASQWGTDNTLSGTNQWSDFANSDPIGDIDTAKTTIRRNTGTTPNQLTVGIETFNDLKEHPLILDKYKHTQVGIMTEDLVAAALGVKNLIVGRAAYNTANEGATYSGSDIWGDNALLQRSTPTPGISVPNGCYTFMWDEVGNIPWAIQQYREEQTRSNVTRVLTHADVEVTSAQHGYLFIDTSA